MTGRREVGVRLGGLVRLGLDPRAVLQRHLRHRVDDVVVGSSRADHHDHARPVARPDEDVPRPARTVDEVPCFQGPLLLVEGEERPLRAWDYVHCPPWTEHVLVGAGDGPCAILAVGRRPDTGVVYPASEVAQRHGAGVGAETRDGKEAYGGLPQDQPVGYRRGWL